MQFEGVLPEAALCVTYAPVDLDGQIGIVVGLPPPRYSSSFVWLYTWTSPSPLYMVMAAGIPCLLKHMISILDSDTARPLNARITTITPITFLGCSGVARRLQRRQRKSYFTATSPELALRRLCPTPPLSLLSS